MTIPSERQAVIQEAIENTLKDVRHALEADGMELPEQWQRDEYQAEQLTAAVMKVLSSQPPPAERPTQALESLRAEAEELYRAPVYFEYANAIALRGKQLAARVLHALGALPAAPLVASPVLPAPKTQNPCPVCGTFLWDDPRPCWNCKRVAAVLPPAKTAPTDKQVAEFAAFMSDFFKRLSEAPVWEKLDVDVYNAWIEDMLGRAADMLEHMPQKAVPAQAVPDAPRFTREDCDHCGRTMYQRDDWDEAIAEAIALGRPVPERPKDSDG